jgi:periplasmic divalent cation tolerance protein
MKSAAQFHIVLVTAPNRKIARQLAKSALQARLAACANLIPGLESHYWWKGRVESATEILIIFKTLKKKLNKLEKLVLVDHPYDTPEFVVFQLTAGTERYLAWLERETEQNRANRLSDPWPKKAATSAGAAHSAPKGRRPA